MVINPISGAAIVIVGEHMMIVDIEAGQHGGARGAAHWSGHVAIGVGHPLPGHQPVQLGHELEAAELRVLVVCQDQDDVGARAGGEVGLPVGLVHNVLVGSLCLNFREKDDGEE